MMIAYAQLLVHLSPVGTAAAVLLMLTGLVQMQLQGCCLLPDLLLLSW